MASHISVGRLRHFVSATPCFPPRFTSKLVNSRTTHHKPSTGGFLRYLVPVEPHLALPYRFLATPACERGARALIPQRDFVSLLGAPFVSARSNSKGRASAPEAHFLSADGAPLHNCHVASATWLFCFGAPPVP